MRALQAWGGSSAGLLASYPALVASLAAGKVTILVAEVVAVQIVLFDRGTIVFAVLPLQM